MVTSSTDKFVKIIQKGQAQMLNYLRRADERGERRSRATIKTLFIMQDTLQAVQTSEQAVQASLRAIQAGQQDIATLTARTLELTRDIHSEVLDKKSSQH
jgi:hypothetical protein